MTARIAILDIERQSGIADGIWELRQNGWLNPSQVIDRPRTICFAYKWFGEETVEFHAEWDKHGAKGMIKKAHKVLDEADFVIGWNSKRFDIPHLRTEMIVHGLPPYSPAKDIDLMVQAKRHFKFLSNRMNEVAKVLDQKGKAATGGNDLWRKLRNARGDELREARQLMAEYNCRDVELTEELYLLMRPWLSGINLPAYSNGDGPACPACESTSIQYRGLARTTTRSYRRFQCTACGKWGRTNASASSTSQVPL